MMKTTFAAFLVFQSFTFSALAEERGLPPINGTVLNCKFNEIKNFSQLMRTSLESLNDPSITVRVVSCKSENKAYELAIVGPSLRKSELNEGYFQLKSAQDEVTGVYTFSGFPMGFQTSAYQYNPSYLNQNGYRVLLAGNSELFKSNDLKNSALIILPAASAGI